MKNLFVGFLLTLSLTAIAQNNDKLQDGMHSFPLRSDFDEIFLKSTVQARLDIISSLINEIDANNNRSRINQEDTLLTLPKRIRQVKSAIQKSLMGVPEDRITNNHLSSDQLKLFASLRPRLVQTVKKYFEDRSYFTSYDERSKFLNLNEVFNALFDSSLEQDSDLVINFFNSIKLHSWLGFFKQSQNISYETENFVKHQEYREFLLYLLQPQPEINSIDNNKAIEIVKIWNQIYEELSLNYINTNRFIETLRSLNISIIDFVLKFVYLNQNENDKFYEMIPFEKISIDLKNQIEEQKSNLSKEQLSDANLIVWQLKPLSKTGFKKEFRKICNRLLE